MEPQPNAFQEYLPLVTPIIRQGLTFAGALGVGWALTVSGSQVELVAGAGVALASTVWSLVQKVRAKAALRRAARAAPNVVAPILPA